ncbi:MAG: hypothetical protein ACE5JP_16525 [Candidatus Bipolaricaulia bacterium]
MAEQGGLRSRLKLAIWGMAVVLIGAILYLFEVTPAEIAHQVSRCISCH